MLMPSELASQATMRRFSKSILNLLERGFLVRIGLVVHSQLGIPQDRSTLTVLATPFPGLLLALKRNPVELAPKKSIRDAIGDLAFLNPRTSEGTLGGFACYRPGPTGGAIRTASENIYNHRTGQVVPNGEKLVVEMDAEWVALCSSSARSLVHPGKSAEELKTSAVY